MPFSDDVAGTADAAGPSWCASVAMLEAGGYEVVRRDTSRREHEVSVETTIDRIAVDLANWLAARAD
ncbi:hypothetical protein ACGFYP_33510 [Streptomyces sp. NPDC048370]|uniref:hypothetical protein n=1 Tax=Streptomyces sp. NPDC048370 TaxID=3365540 RepID=UPI00372364DB